MDENETWDNPLLPMLKKNALPQQRLYFCLAINAMNMGFLQTFFFRACWQMIVVIERLFVCQRAVENRGQSSLNWINRLCDDDGVSVLPR
jgi:hypothetical protein